MTTITKAFIYNYIKQNPGCRRRDMPGWRRNLPLILAVLEDLEADGVLEERLFNDPANMEYYYQYYIKEA